MNAIGRLNGEFAPPVILLLPLIIFVPAAAFYLGWASSLALGTATVGVLAMLLAVLAPRLLTSALIDGSLIGGSAVLLLSAHLLVANLWVPVDFPRAIGSLVVLFLTVVGGITTGLALTGTDDRSLHRALHICFWLLVGAGFLGAFDIVPIASPTARYYERPVFPFTEPSHYALCMTPILAYCAVTANRVARAVYLGIVLIIFVLLQSLTMASGWLLVAIVCARGFFVPSITAAMGWLAYTYVDLQYYLDRLDIGQDSGNISNLIYFQGWELIGESLTNSHYWGLGFQQLGVFGTDVPNSRIIYLLVGEFSNLLDGGFTFSKITSELGLFGVAISAYLVYLAARAFFTLRKVAAKPGSLPARQIFMHAIFLGFMVDLLLRGAGYFTTTGLLLVAALRIRVELSRSKPGWARRLSPSRAFKLRTI